VGGEGTQIVVFGDGDVEPAFGLLGGGDGTLNKVELRYPDGRIYRATSKDLIRDVPVGTVYVQEAGGGGGYGDPRERDPRVVREEVRNGIISEEAARRIYGVEIER
jgi:N-methylhydantoinase B